MGKRMIQTARACCEGAAERMSKKKNLRVVKCMTVTVTLERLDFILEGYVIKLCAVNWHGQGGKNESARVRSRC
jgi:hypothetical protein